MRHGISRTWFALAAASALVGCGHFKHCTNCEKRSTGEPPLACRHRRVTAETAPIVAAPKAAPAETSEELVVVTVTAPGPNGSSVQGLVEMTAAEASAMGMRPGYSSAVAYAPAGNRNTALAKGSSEPEIHPVSHQVEGDR